MSLSEIRPPGLCVDSTGELAKRAMFTEVEVHSCPAVEHIVSGLLSLLVSPRRRMR